MELNCFSTEIQNCPIKEKTTLENFVSELILAIEEYRQNHGDVKANLLEIKARHLFFVIGMFVREVWDSKHRPKGMPTIAYPQHKPLGELYEKVLGMSERLKTFDKIKDHPLPEGSPLEWTLNSIVEGKLEGINGGTKSECLKKIEKNSVHLRKIQNPFTLEESHDAPITFTLLQLGSIHANANDNFRKKYWNPLKQSYANWKKEYKSQNWRSATINSKTGGVKYNPEGSKKGMVSLIPPQKRGGR